MNFVFHFFCHRKKLQTNYYYYDIYNRLKYKFKDHMVHINLPGQNDNDVGGDDNWNSIGVLFPSCNWMAATVAGVVTLNVTDINAVEISIINIRIVNKKVNNMNGHIVCWLCCWN